MTRHVLPQRVAVVPGDGIGPDVMAAGVAVIRALAPDIEIVTYDYSADQYLQDGRLVDDSVRREWADNFGSIFMGPVGDPRIPDIRHGKAMLLDTRMCLDLFINLRPVTLLDPRRCPLRDATRERVDMVFFRENTEDLYTGIGGTFKKGTLEEVATEHCVASRLGVERIIRAAFEYARLHGRRKVTMSDKSNAMRHVGDLWQRVFKLVAAEYPDIESNHLYVDVLAMQMVAAPHTLDVVVTSNLFGDIVTDIGAILQGGIGLAPSGNIHPGKCSLFQPVHGSAPDIAGKGIANPLAAVLSAGMLLTHMGQPELETRIQNAVRACLNLEQVTTELGGRLNTEQATDAVLRNLV